MGADQTSNTYYEWLLERVFLVYGAQAIAAQWAATFKDFPPIQKPNTFTLDDALKMMHETLPERIEPAPCLWAPSPKRAAHSVPSAFHVGSTSEATSVGISQLTSVVLEGLRSPVPGLHATDRSLSCASGFPTDVCSRP